MYEHVNILKYSCTKAFVNAFYFKNTLFYDYLIKIRKILYFFCFCILSYDKKYLSPSSMTLLFVETRLNDSVTLL